MKVMIKMGLRTAFLHSIIYISFIPFISFISFI